MRSVIFLSVGLSVLGVSAAETKTDPRYPFRTDFANEHLPWYQPKPLEFPPHHSDRRISGELVSVDFIHRKGQFRASKTGELMDFTLPPYGIVSYLNAEADLREIPLGTFFLFFLNQDEDGNFTRLATAQDQFTMDAGHSFTYRLDAVQEGRLQTTRHSLPKKQDDLGKKEWLLKPDTKFWKAGKPVTAKDLKPGDELLFNITGKTAASPGWCTDIWVGTETHKQATDQQRQKFADFTKARGLAGWINKTQGNEIWMAFFSGDSKTFEKTWMADFAVGKSVKVCVANDELRTWNPPVDGDGGSVLEIQKVPADGYGCSGIQLKVKVNNMLEGFRKGRVIRIFGAGWKTQDQFYGESLMGYGFGRMLNQELVENPPKEYPEQFPFRTDFGNRHLPWWKLESGVKPPPFAEHLVLGELVKVDSSNRGGQFRLDRTNTLVDFNLTPEGTARYLTADGPLSDIPLGTRCRFHLFQDGKGAFTLASLVSDEFSHMFANALTWRVDSINAAEGIMHVAWQLPKVKDYNGDMQQPPDIGRSVLHCSKDTRCHRGDKQVPVGTLAVGDVLRANLTAEKPGQPSRALEIWIGEDTHTLVSDSRKKKPVAKK